MTLFYGWNLHQPTRATYYMYNKPWQVREEQNSLKFLDKDTATPCSMIVTFVETRLFPGLLYRMVDPKERGIGFERVVVAIEEGLPYQSLVTSILHKYVTGQLIEN